MVDNPEIQPGAKPPKDWVFGPFDTYLDKFHHLHQITYLTTRGIAMHQSMPNVVEALSKYHILIGDKDAHDEDELSSARDIAALAKEEVDNDFPQVYANAVINIWTLLEALVRTFIVEMLQNEPTAFQVSEVQQLRIRLGEYHLLSDDERYFYIAESLEKEIAAGTRYGPGRFEALLRPFGLSGDVPEKIGRDIWELAQIRNGILHRAGIADKRLVEACSWLGLHIGDVITVDHAMYERYIHASSEYVTALIHRIMPQFPRDSSNLPFPIK